MVRFLVSKKVYAEPSMPWWGSMTSSGIGKIFSRLKENLQVGIGIPARRFMEISRRKRLRSICFIDQMEEAINRKAAEADAYVPEKANRRS